VLGPEVLAELQALLVLEALQLGLGGEGLVAAVTGMGSNLQVDLEMMLPGRGILEGLATVRTDVNLLVGIIKVSSPDVSLQVARMVELLLAVGTVEPSNFVLRVVSLQVVSQHTAGHVALQTDRTLELQLGGVELHVVGEGLGGAEDLVAGLTEMLWSCGGAVSLHMFLQICLFVEPETALGAGKLWTGHNFILLVDSEGVGGGGGGGGVVGVSRALFRFVSSLGPSASLSPGSDRPHLLLLAWLDLAWLSGH